MRDDGCSYMYLACIYIMYVLCQCTTHYTWPNCQNCDYCIAGALVGVVSGLAVLLFISVTINILAIIYKLRGKLTQCGGGGRDNVEQVDKQVNQKLRTETVAMKQNEAYEDHQLHSYPKD